MRFIYWAAATLPGALAAPLNPQNLQNAVNPNQLKNPLTIGTGTDPISEFLRKLNSGEPFTSSPPKAAGGAPTVQKREPINPLEVVDGLARKVTGSSTGIARRGSSGDEKAAKKKFGQRRGLFPFGGDVRGVHAGNAGLDANNLGREKRNDDEFPFNNQQNGQHSVILNPLLNTHGNDINRGFGRRDSADEVASKQVKRNDDEFPFNNKQNGQHSVTLDPLLNTHGNDLNRGFGRRDSANEVASKQVKRNDDEGPFNNQQNGQHAVITNPMMTTDGNTNNHGFGRRDSIDETEPNETEPKEIKPEKTKPKEAKRNNDEFPFNNVQNGQSSTVIEPLLNTHGNLNNKGFGRREVEKVKRNGDEGPFNNQQNSQTSTGTDPLLQTGGNIHNEGFGRRDSADN
ncbi:TPA_exp: Uncharacterized protein A8136_1436 [Trichophyton benhamiae CBS 112371]|uniref:Uncharacterized protein n=1 Tax=Arthroderma benhamiae (strain ATCC MYA-4681 / CBS 112371) TaxID=663331 RepID=D4AW89_ARTBC|nr:uncharacterized protein ARB_00454 [Trichophyton benhamiae CBS 112371]EFE32629.1 hypothetical protein ARB_00454 [Trichophyton benhamiae CBS 112371]DAA75714.1 TPA_exp: Uncharacterized protein A8136_1436 [Trichophyton benhamiae CBS 112371]